MTKQEIKKTQAELGYLLKCVHDEINAGDERPVLHRIVGFMEETGRVLPDVAEEDRQRLLLRLRTYMRVYLGTDWMVDRLSNRLPF